MKQSAKQTTRIALSGIAGRRPPLSTFARRLLTEWKRLGLPQEGQRVAIAVSGGADSVALLLAVDELVRAGKTDLDIVAAHLNHRLRGAASEADARWVNSLAKQLKRRAIIKSAEVRKRAQRSDENLEQAARRARYGFLLANAKSSKTKLVLTAHTMNDQAETILLNLIRGAGPDGLGGIEPMRPIVEGSDILE